MGSQWQVLIGNLASVSLLISLWMHIHYKLYRLSRVQVRLGFGVMMGTGAVLSMLMAVELKPGVYFDLRASLLGISAIYGGPVAVCIAMPMALCFRALMGGAGAINGMIGILAVSLVGLLVHYAIGRRRSDPVGIAVSALAVMAPSLALGLYFTKSGSGLSFSAVILPMAMLNGLATMLASAVMIYFQKFMEERDILRAALTQAPDFHYVKNIRSEFVITNLNVARQSGRNKSSDMVGLSDFDIAPSGRAQSLFDIEQDLIRTGGRVADHEECLRDKAGHEKWYSSSKVTLRNLQGDIIGLAGVTRDITGQKAHERELLDSRNLLSQAMAEMSDGLAMFDPNGYLVFCNTQYKAAFPLSAYAREPGAHITDIVRAVVRNGERKDVPTNVGEDWIQTAGRELFASRDTEIPLYNDRWLSLRTRLGSDGSALVVVSDMTVIKQSEHSLKQLADRMKGLAETDALTGVSNRRAFDEALAAACAQAERSRAPLSLLLIDIDRFKAYNDTYGHPAGDHCLKAVGQCLGIAAQRPTDLVARYGGEEFAILLPGSDRAGARAVAERFRSALADSNLHHAGSEFGVVTASVGVATFDGGLDHHSPADLVAAADLGLYHAKDQGRNRVETAPVDRNARTVAASFGMTG